MSSTDQPMVNILNSVPQPVWVVARDGHIFFANPASVAALGYDDASELSGRFSHATVHYRRLDGSPYPEAECPMLSPRMTGQTVHGEDEWFVRRDGSMFPIAWWSAPIELPGGLGAVFSFTDITDRRQAEQTVQKRAAAEIRAAEALAAQRRSLQDQVTVRRKVAQDLHDGAQQRLVTLLIALQLAGEELSTSSGKAAELIALARNEAQDAIAELRELAAGIHPVILSSRGLGAAVEALAGRAPLPVVVTGSLDHRLPSAIESQAYYFVAEGLTNAVKHARASVVRIAIEFDSAALVVEVSDDGIGGARRDGNGNGSGLIGLADRVEALDGVFQITSHQGRGTILRAEFPLPAGNPQPSKPAQW